jgi:hypothetical protein
MRSVLGLVLVLALASAASGQGVEDLDFLLPLFEGRVVGDELVLLGTGGCRVEGPGFSVVAERVVLWCDPTIERHLDLLGGTGAAEGEAPPAPKSPEEVLGPLIHAVYAAGRVRYERLDEKITIEAERFYADFRKHRGYVKDARLTALLVRDEETEPVPLIVRAEEIRQVAERELRARRATVTTCEFEEPHYEISVEDLIVRGGAEEGVRFRSGPATFRSGSVPFFWLPYLSGDSRLTLRPFRSASVGASSRYGNVIETLWGDDILHGGERWGEWFARLDYRSRRGPGVGLDLPYETDLYRGMLRGYVQRDWARTDRTTDDPVPRTDRGRLWWQHRFDFENDWRLDLEAHLLSDRGYRLEFWEREAREDKEAETYAQLRKILPGFAGFALVRGRVNDFQTRTEYVPRVSGTLISWTAAEGVLGVRGWRLLVEGEAAIDRVRRRYDTDTGRPAGPWVERGDVLVAARSPFGVGPVRISPVLGVRGTAFSDTLDGGGRGRIAAEGAIRADLTLSRAFPGVRSEALGLDGLRHTMHVDLEYANRWHVSLDPEELYPHDELEQIRESQVVRLRYRNRFLTRRGEVPSVVTALDLEIEAEYFPVREIARDRSVVGLAFLEGRLVAPLSDEVTVRADYDYDVNRWEWLTASTGVDYRPTGAMWSVAAEHRFIGDEQNLLGGWVDLRPTSRYGFRSYARYDFDSGRLNRLGLLIRRFAHDFVLEVDLRVNEDLDEVSLSFSLLPRGFSAGPRTGREAIDDFLLEDRRDP